MSASRRSYKPRQTPGSILKFNVPGNGWKPAFFLISCRTQGMATNCAPRPNPLNTRPSVKPLDETTPIAFAEARGGELFRVSTLCRRPHSVPARHDVYIEVEKIQNASDGVIYQVVEGLGEIVESGYGRHNHRPHFRRLDHQPKVPHVQRRLPNH